MTKMRTWEYEGQIYTTPQLYGVCRYKLREDAPNYDTFYQRLRDGIPPEEAVARRHREYPWSHSQELRRVAKRLRGNGVSHREISRRLGVPYPTVKGWFSKRRKRRAEPTSAADRFLSRPAGGMRRCA